MVLLFAEMRKTEGRMTGDEGCKCPFGVLGGNNNKCSWL